MILLTVLLLVSSAAALDQTQLAGFKELLTGLPNGVFATCKMVLFSEQLDFDTAEDKCKNFDIGGGIQNGNLATVSDDDKNRDLTLLLELAYPIAEQPTSKWGPTRWVWAGLRKVTNNGVDGYSKEYNPEEWEWATGDTAAGYEKWFSAAQPDQATEKNGKGGCKEEPKCYQNQMRINHEGLWDDTYKYKEHPYACDYQGKYILSPEKKSWEDAKVACEAAGLVMAKVRSEEESGEMQTAIKYFLGPQEESWTKWDPNNWVWLGGTDSAKEGKWKWTDGDRIKWKFPWIKKAGGDNAKKNKKMGIVMKEGQDALTMNRDGLFDDSFKQFIERPFACQCPGT